MSPVRRRWADISDSDPEAATGARQFQSIWRHFGHGILVAVRLQLRQDGKTARANQFCAELNSKNWKPSYLLAWQRRLQAVCCVESFPCALWRDFVFFYNLRLQLSVEMFISAVLKHGAASVGHRSLVARQKYLRRKCLSYIFPCKMWKELVFDVNLAVSRPRRPGREENGQVKVQPVGLIVARPTGSSFA
ncbi:hypothetical protein AK812_SmicGene43928 [Symbiodinium microadriaticum]|uniref:Uncharacterized protein n=1 Tax=Symbiodinium microadriaticum TaxID=2951 RepID=A0A1Q9BZS3_SYMMI|nr:hypothetical protein AK812_SmicGene43928 [Symbiodinium microadriaticum]